MNLHTIKAGLKCKLRTMAKLFDDPADFVHPEGARYWSWLRSISCQRLA
jgi:hypothetical protein